MLLSTFKYLPGIRRNSEPKLWQQGIFTLDDLKRSQTKQRDLFDGVESPLLTEIGVLERAIQDRDFEALSTHLDPEDYFRVALTFPDDTLFLDIETTGLSKYYDKVTLVGWNLRSSYGVYVRGGDPHELYSILERASVVVTYNGTLFDLPFIQKEFPKAQLPPIHVDLRYLAKRVGLTGGQKTIEEVLGLLRPKLVRTVVGELAPILWAKYRRGSVDAIKRLIHYNHADVHGLGVIFDAVTDRLSERISVPPAIRDTFPRFAKATKLSFAQSNVATKKVGNAVTLFQYSGDDSSFANLSSLYAGLPGADLTIVGIDLTGSEQRPSGWSRLRKYAATTRLIATDADLIKATLRAKPDLVSIDSPLSLPRGRKTVFDDDPGRAEFGIMRTCERILKRRGINVYPCLLPSMQKLTARGIRLAAELRTRGIPVIESYPGAAQDIMNIPRKRAGLELLKAGLREFGVGGSFLRRRVSHDELDALTSAVVGVFFFAGRFEALGDETEEALIVPDLSTEPSKWVGRKVVGFSGPLAAGKTTAARVLEGERFVYARYSMVLGNLLEQKQVKATRQNLQEYGLYVNRKVGQRWLGRELLRLLPSDRSIAIDGMRFPDDYALLVETFGPAFRHIYVHATRENRKARYEARESITERSFDEADSHEVEFSAVPMKALKNVTILENDASAANFKRRVKRLSRS